MRVRNSLSPYPILYDYKDDYVDSSFRADIEAKEHFSSIIFDVQFKLVNSTIQQLINEGKAAFVLHVECPALSLRREFVTTDDHLSATFEADDLAETLEVCTFIVVQDELKNYSNPQFHPDYQGLSFSLIKGQMLAIGDTKVFDIEKNKDKLQALPSILRIAKSTDSSKGTMVVNTDNPAYISVGLTEEAFSLYSSLGKHEYPKAILGLVLFPALIVVLQRVSSEPEAFGECKWFEILTDLLENNGYSWAELGDENGDAVILTVAQAIFSNPVLGGLKELQASVEGE